MKRKVHVNLYEWHLVCVFTEEVIYLGVPCSAQAKSENNECQELGFSFSIGLKNV